MHLLRSGHGFFHTVLQITSTSCTQIAELLILMVCPARLCSISSHGSGDPSGRQCLGKMPCVCVCSVAQLCLFLCNLMDCQSPLSMVFPMQECWSGFPFASPGDIPDPEIEPEFLHCRWFLCHWATEIQKILLNTFLNCYMPFHHFPAPLNDCF